VEVTKFVPLSEIETRPINWAIKPVLEKGQMLCLVGHGGQGKSTLMADISCDIADQFFRSLSPPDVLAKLDEEFGASPWKDGFCAGGSLQVSPDLSPVLIVDGENTARAWLRLCSKTLATYGINPQSLYAKTILEQIHHVRSTEYGLERSDRRAEANFELFQDAAKDGFQTIIIDPLWKVYSPESAGDPSWVTSGISRLRDLCTDAGITVICVAHPAADSEGRGPDRKVQPFGSSQQHGMYDALLYLKRSGNTGTLSLHKTRAQDWIQPRAKVKLEYGSRGGGFNKCKEIWPLEEPVDGIYLTDHAFAMLKGCPAEPFRLEDVPDLTPKTARKYLDSELIPAGCAAQVAGTGVKGDPKMFAVTELGYKHLTYKEKQ